MNACCTFLPTQTNDACLCTVKKRGLFGKHFLGKAEGRIDHIGILGIGLELACNGG